MIPTQERKMILHRTRESTAVKENGGQRTEEESQPAPQP